MPPSEHVYRQVRKWTQHVNIFDRDYLVIPICEHLHWYMAIIVNPWAILLKDNLSTERCSSKDVLEREASENAAELSTVLPKKDEAMADNLSSSGSEGGEPPSSPQVFSSTASSLIGKAKSSVASLIAGIASSPADKSASLSKDPDDECTIVRSGDASPRCMIMVYDSLGPRSKTAVIRRLKEYLLREAADKLKLAVDIKQCTGFSLHVPPSLLPCVGPIADELDRLRSFHVARNSALPSAIRSA